MIAAAARIFGERGYHGASMDEIAAAAEITKPMLYSYFGSKDGLFAACGEAAAQELRERVTGAARQRDLSPDERLWRGLVSVFTFIGEHRTLWALFTTGRETVAEGTEEVARSGRDAMVALMEELLIGTAVGEGIAATAALEAAPLAHSLTAAVIGQSEWWLAHPEEPAELQALRIMNLVWNGFENLIGGRLWLPSE